MNWAWAARGLSVWLAFCRGVADIARVLRNKPVPLGVLDVIDAISLAGVLSLDGKSDRSRFGIAPQGRLPDLKYLNSGI